MSEPHTPAQETRRLGRGMMIAAWILGLALLSLLFGGVMERQRNPNQRPAAMSAAEGAREVHLLRNRYGHYLADGTINDHPVEFLLDTGASDVAIPEGIARRAGLQRGTPRYYETANGTIKAYATVLERLELGELELHAVRASINPQMEGETVLLGMSVLKQWEFTQRGDTLIIRHYKPQQAQ